MAQRYKLPKRQDLRLMKYGLVMSLANVPFTYLKEALESEEWTMWQVEIDSPGGIGPVNRHKTKLIIRELKYRERLKKRVKTYTDYEVRDWHHSGHFAEVHKNCEEWRSIFDYRVHHGMTPQEIWRHFGQKVRLIRGVIALAESNSIKLTYGLSRAIAKSYVAMLRKEEQRLRERVIQALDKRTTLIKDHSKSLDAGSVIAKYDI